MAADRLPHPAARRRLEESARAESTRDNYAATMRKLDAFRERMQLGEADDDQVILLFCRHRAHLGHATLRRELAAIRAWYADRGLADPTGPADELVTTLLRLVGRRGEHEAMTPLVWADVEQIVAGIGPVSADALADPVWFEDTGARTAIGTMYLTGRRGDDMTRLTVRRCTVETVGVALYLPRQKTDQAGRGEWLHLGHLGPAPTCRPGCVACALTLYVTALRARYPRWDGALFPAYVNDDGPHGTISVERLTLELKALVQRPGRFGTRSARKGRATDMIAAGDPIAVVADQLGHRSTATTQRYVTPDPVGLLGLGAATAGTTGTTGPAGGAIPARWADWADPRSSGVGSGFVECPYNEARPDTGTRETSECRARPQRERSTS